MSDSINSPKFWIKRGMPGIAQIILDGDIRTYSDNEICLFRLIEPQNNMDSSVSLYIWATITPNEQPIEIFENDVRKAFERSARKQWRDRLLAISLAGTIIGFIIYSLCYMIFWS